MYLLALLSQFFHRWIYGNFDTYLKTCRGVIHVGANSGQERDDYDRLGLNVIWIEPIPDIFETLRRNVLNYSKQRAIMALVADQDDRDLAINIANNGGASSSIFDFARHKDLWPEVHYVDRVTLKTVTLPTLIAREHIDLSQYDALLIDTQGAEYSILKGAEQMLKHFRFIQVEAADFDAYAGAAQRDVITDFLAAHGFVLIREQAIVKKIKIGGYFDLLFERR